MAVRFYFPSSGAAPVSPSFGTGWNSTPNASRLALVRFLTGTAMTDKTEVGTATTPEFVLVRQYVGEPLAPQDIIGATIKGTVRAWENSAAKNATLAIAVRLVRRDGSDYGTPKYLIGATPNAADATTTPPEFAGTTVAAIISRQFNTSAESPTMPTTNLFVEAGDRLVVEIGYRDATTSTTTTASLNFGDNSGSPLGENNTTTAANNPWLEMSQTLAFAEPVTLQNYMHVQGGDGLWVGRG